MSREANRARFPLLAEIKDRYPGAKLLWAKDANGEIGRQPVDAWSMGADAYIALDAHYRAAKLDEYGRGK